MPARLGLRLGDHLRRWGRLAPDDRLGGGTLKFWWKVSSEGTCDFLEFYIDGDERDSISGETTWAEKTYTITGAGTHTLRWRYAKSGTGSAGEDRAWVDYVQWTDAMEEPDPNDWSTLNYVYDASGRRIEKKYDGCTVLKYVYDGGHCIAEYDAGGNLRRKYIYGPGVDQPLCMIEAPLTDPNYYYYHFDGLGNVVALTDDEGDTVQVYEYDVYGRVGATDANHPNRFLFTGREFDEETSLYYYRARCYNASTGRFLQVDPVGYAAAMNLYRYCDNNPTNMIDPYGWNPITEFIYGPGEIRITSSCIGTEMAILPEHSGTWITDPVAEQVYEADAVAWYTPDGNQAGLKVPDNCSCVVLCVQDIKDPSVYDLIFDCNCTGILGWPTWVTPGKPPKRGKPVWPPALPEGPLPGVQDPGPLFPEE